MMKIETTSEAMFWLIRSVEGIASMMERDAMRIYRPGDSHLVRLKSMREEINALVEYGNTIAPYWKLPPNRPTPAMRANEV